MDSEKVRECLLKGKDFLLETVRDVCETQADEAFVDAVELGIYNTIASLYDANVSDDEIIRILNKFWGINKAEAEDRILYEKSEAVKRELQHYLKMQGCTKEQIAKFAHDTQAYVKIKHEQELWKYRKEPAKLVKLLRKEK